MTTLDLEALRGLVEAALKPFAGDYMLSEINPKTRVASAERCRARTNGSRSRA
jgi:hypothetical protein